VYTTAIARRINQAEPSDIYPHGVRLITFLRKVVDEVDQALD
jgi:hypothetical protein